MAAHPGDGAPEAAVAVAVCGGPAGVRRSRRAVCWAAAHLFPHAHRVILVHVIPAITSIPSPSGVRVPVDRMGPELVDMYVQDQKSKAQQVFLPFMRHCGTGIIETVVLEGENPAAALLKYVSDSGTRNLVLGSSSNWFRRVLKGQDVPTTVLKFPPISCNFFVVSRSKLIMKFFNQSVPDDSNPSTCVRTVSHRLFDENCVGSRSQDFSIQKSSVSDANSETSLHTGDHKEGELISKLVKVGTRRTLDVVASIRDISLIIFHSRKGESSPDVSNMRKELQHTLAKYNQVCDDLVHAKKKVQFLSAESSEAEKKVKHAMGEGEVLKKIAAEESSKNFKAIEEVGEAKKLSLQEAMQEPVTGQVPPEEVETFDSYFLNSKWCRRYSKNAIEVATDNFSEAKKIGEGSCGNVYKCILDHTTVAIKVVFQDARHKKEQFLREAEILSQLHHPNMVLLLGVCPENGCLVYEFMENGSLEDLLFNKDGKKSLPWVTRFRILHEVVCGLAFLHDNKPEPIVHRDLKPGNILLDKNYVGKIGDVGLAKLLSDVVPDGLTEYRETVLAGTFCYMDPEYQRTGTVRPKSDLYAWGVIALQLLTGRYPNGLIITIERAIQTGKFPDVLDKSITDWPLVEAERLAKLALQCSSLRCRDRPDLDSVLPALEDILNKAYTHFISSRNDIDVPKHYICPLLQEIMDEAYAAADGYTYEHRAIKAWLEKHDISPVTKLELPHTSIIPNLSLRSAIQEWKLHVASSAAWS